MLAHKCFIHFMNDQTREFPNINLWRSELTCQVFVCVPRASIPPSSEWQWRAGRAILIRSPLVPELCHHPCRTVFASWHAHSEYWCRRYPAMPWPHASALACRSGTRPVWFSHSPVRRPVLLARLLDSVGCRSWLSLAALPIRHLSLPRRRTSRWTRGEERSSSKQQPFSSLLQKE